MTTKVIKRIQISRVLQSRYNQTGSDQSGLLQRPSSWDERQSGVDIVETTDGKQICLLSDGAQSTPKPGWVLAITGGSENTGYSWTLYGLAHI